MPVMRLVIGTIPRSASPALPTVVMGMVVVAESPGVIVPLVAIVTVTSIPVVLQALESVFPLSSLLIPMLELLHLSMKQLVSANIHTNIIIILNKNE